MWLASSKLQARSLVTLGLTAALAACADPVAPSLDAEPAGIKPNAAMGLDPTPGTLREVFGSGMVVAAGRDLRIDVCASPGSCIDAYVLDRHPRWAAPIAGTQWIGPRPIADVDYTIPVQNDVYETTFMLPAGFSAPVLNVQLYADNAATIYVNGVQIGQQPQGDVYPNYGCIAPTEPAAACTDFRAPFDYTTTGNSVAVPWTAGVNTVRIVVLNAEYKQGCENVDQAGPECRSATALDFKAMLHYALAGGQGCTLGYWKNHVSNWPAAYSTSSTLGSVFALTGPVSPDATLLAALNFDGGSGIDGAQRILFKQAVAALLNAEHMGVAYAWSPAQVIAEVNAALASNNRDTILALATRLDRLNNAGCPLGR